MTVRVDAFDIVTAVADRLDEAGIYRNVLGALDASALKTWPKTPAVFVVPLAETVADSLAPRAGAVQRVETTVAIQTLIAAPNDPTGRKARTELANVLGASRGVLSGWCPEGAAEALTWRRGLLLGLENGRLEWRDEYALVWWIEAGAGVRDEDPNLPASMRRQR